MTMNTGSVSNLKVEEDAPDDFQPKTEFGRRLLEIRKQIVASGEPLLDWEGIQREVAERRGGVQQDED